MSFAYGRLGLLPCKNKYILKTNIIRISTRKFIYEKKVLDSDGQWYFLLQIIQH